MSASAHWTSVYTTKPVTTVSWYQAEAGLSFELITRHWPDRHAAIIDVGAGASVLADALLAAGYADLTLLDIAEPALAQTRTRLGPKGEAVTWLAADLLTADLPPARYDVWHDRAVFHFLTTPADRARYMSQLSRAVVPGGVVILATFAEDGPERCSGLPVARYSGEALIAALGDGFTPLAMQRDVHTTPGGGSQSFNYLVATRL